MTRFYIKIISVMKKHCLLVIALLALFSFNTQAQEETQTKKKNIIYIEGGIPFGFKETKNYWNNPDNFFSAHPEPESYYNYIFSIKYSRNIPSNFQVNIGYKYITVDKAIASKHYTGDWKANTLYLGLGYNLPIIKNLSFVPSINFGYSNLSYRVLHGWVYYTPNGATLILRNAFRQIETNPLYLNAELALNYSISNKWHLRLAIGYDKYFVKDLADTEEKKLTDKKEFKFQSLEAKLGLGFSF